MKKKEMKILDAKTLEMKKFFWLAVFLPFLSFSQNIIKDKVDVTGRRTISTNIISFSSPSASAYSWATVDKADTTQGITLYFIAETTLSTDKQTEIIMNLANHETIIFHNLNKYNLILEGRSGFVSFLVSPEKLETLSKEKVLGYRISTDEANVSVDLKGKDQKLFHELLESVNKHVKSQRK